MMMNDYAMTKEEKLSHENEWNDKFGNADKVDMTKPHISNLNQDPMLSLKIHYSIDQECTTIGRRNVDPQNNI